MKHYQRWLKHGDPRFVAKPRQRRGEGNPAWKGDRVSYAALHIWMAKNYPKRGVCEQCGSRVRTQYAVRHSGRYTRDRDDWRELCARCHADFDGVADLRRGIPRSPETIEKMRVAATGRSPSAETRAKLSAALRGRPKSPETRAKMRAAAKRRRRTSGQRQAL
jgi:hypothetical protein